MFSLSVVFVIMSFQQLVWGDLSSVGFTKRVEVVETSVGPVRAIVVEPDSPKNQSSMTLLGIHGMSPILKYEWIRVAESLAARYGYKVILPDFHSNVKTKPGQLKSAAFEDIINNAFIKNMLRGSKNVVLMGKSWGGKMVATYASSEQNQSKLRGMVLAAPAGISDFGSLKGVGSMHVLIMYALDDETFGDSIEKWKRLVPADHLTIHTEKWGGHRIMDNYAGYIHKYVHDVVEK